MSADATEQDSRSKVIDVARALWPHPVTVSIQRRSSRTAREWLVVPTLRHPLWLLPTRRPGAARALLRHDLGQRRQWIAPLLCRLYDFAPVARLPLARVRVEDDEGVLTIEDELTRLLDVPVEVCVRLGRTRANRAMVLRPVDDSGHAVAFVKMATNAEGELALRLEAANLERVGSVGVHPVVAPELISLERWNGHLTMVMSALLPAGTGTGRTDMPEQAMLDFARFGGTTLLPLRQAPVIAAQLRAIEQLPSGAGNRQQLGEAWFRLMERHGDRALPVGCWHGDWVPWNMAWAGDLVQLWDWEHYEEGVPLGWDPLHYYAQDLRTFRGTAERVEQEWLDAARGLLRRTLGLAGEDAEAVIVSYLLQINVRYVSDRGDLDSTRCPRPGWGLPLLTRLLRGGCP